jgi:hypothetical protein
MTRVEWELALFGGAVAALLAILLEYVGRR